MPHQDGERGIEPAVVQVPDRLRLGGPVAEPVGHVTRFVRTGQARSGELLDHRAGAVACRVQALLRTLGRHAQVRRGEVHAGHEHGLSHGPERRPGGHLVRGVRAAGVVPVHQRRGAVDLLLVDGVVRGVDDQAGGTGAQVQRPQSRQAAVRGGAEREPVVHGRRGREHHPVPLVAVQRDGRAAGPEVVAEPPSQLLARPGRGQVRQRTLHSHLQRHGPVDLASPGEQPADLAGEHPASGVVLQRQLSLGHPQDGRGPGVQDLLDDLQLDEMVARPDRPEPEPRGLEGQPGQLTAKPGHAAVAIEVEATALLDPRQRVRLQPVAVDTEGRALVGRAQHIRGRELAAPARRVRVARRHGIEETGYRGPVRHVGVQGHERHPAVDRRAGEGRTDRSDGGHGDAGGHLHVVLVVEVGQHDRWSREVDGIDTARERLQHPRVGGCVDTVEYPRGVLGHRRSRRSRSAP